ncbi:MAG: methyltransferase domain-containing protein [Pseudomonadota bacterium]
MSDDYYDEAGAEAQKRVAMTGDMRAQRQALLDRLALTRGANVLDVGAGNGIMAQEMLDIVGPEGRVDGIDSAEAMVAMARVLCPGGRFRTGSAASLPFEAAAFDAVTTAQVLCFVDDRPAALAEMHRVLRPGGRLVILDSDWDSLVWATNRPDLLARILAVVTGVYASAHVPRHLSAELRAAGFEIVDRAVHPLTAWTLEDDSYAGQLATIAADMMASSDAFSTADHADWTADQAELVAAGRFMFSLNRYIFTARRPG